MNTGFNDFLISSTVKSFPVFITKFFLFLIIRQLQKPEVYRQHQEKNLTLILGIPAGLGSIPDKIKSPSDVFLSDVSLSP